MKKEVVELVAMLKEFESPLRLGLLIALYHVDGYVTFTELYRYLDIPKSTLHSHLTELEKRGYIEYRKAITALGVGTVIKITELGKREVKKYLELISKTELAK